MTHPITIRGRRIGPGEPVYVVAEMASNHGRRLDEAMRILGAAKRAGADAVKLGAAMPPDWPPQLEELAEDLELALLWSPDGKPAKRLAEIAAPAWEVPASSRALVRRLAAGGGPLILATASADAEAIGKALAAARKAGAGELALLWRHDGCPAPARELRLRAIPRLGEAFGVPVGFGDQTLGNAAAVAAVALGAAIVEKHLTLSRTLPVAESAISLEPEEFARLVAAVRTAEDALGGRAEAGGGD
jgi:N-acetylneuraminate synthase